VNRHCFFRRNPNSGAMNKDGTIIIIEDDEDDQFVLEEVFKELG
jgi:hypothetical protein